VKKYGKSKSDSDVEKMILCREIVKEVIDFGVTEDQKLQVIYLLSLELENREKMLGIINLVKDQKQDLKENKKILTIE
tara:strand:+ start:1615 stop:1848 length:234 start_codon:yes stop_codon:yes gene_type:complete